MKEKRVYIIIQTTYYDEMPVGNIIRGVYREKPKLPEDRSIGHYSKVQFRLEEHEVKEVLREEGALL